MPEENEELRAEVERLIRENEELKSRSNAGGVLTSIEGLETFAARIGPDETILHLNTSFARYLGVPRREELVGQKATVLRRFLNQEMLMAIARPAEGQSLMRVAHDDHGKVYEIKTTLHSGMLDVVMQDVTDEQQFRSLVQRYVLKDFDNLSEEDLRTFRFPERRFMSFTFTDLRGFTALTERLSPEEVRGMVNAFYEEVIQTVEENNATVIQLIGDEVMAFYGAPRYFKDHALRAVKTACEQVEKVNELCADYARAGKQMCPCGVGINSGDVVLGNMGGAGKQSYTALGPAVNLASRICGSAQGGQVLLTEAVLNSVLEALPPGWEMTESRSLLGDEEDLSKVGGKIEDVQPLPQDLRGKVVSIGPGLTSQQNPPAFTFRYLYLLKPKGAKELPIMAVTSARHGRRSNFLSEERAAPQHAEVVIGKYHIVEPIGEGGMGKVWKARDQFGNLVAIKMLTAGLAASSSQLQRFKREAAVMGKLSHHNICRIHEIGEAEGDTFIAMEFIDGISLGDIIRHNIPSLPGGARVRSSVAGKSELTDLVKSIKQEKKAQSVSRASAGASGTPAPVPTPSPNSESGPSVSVLSLPLQRVLAMMSAICEAVQFAHEHGVLHRDLKPDNIMLRPDGDPVVTDFGLAKLENDPAEFSLSIEGQIVGTIEYMAPEQAQSSKHVTERADVYSLGAIFYQLLTGRKHFTSSGSLLRDAQTLQDYESPRLRQFNKEVDRDLETIVLKALRPTAVQRYTSVQHLLEDVKRYQAGDSITARAPTIADRVVKRVRKHRTAVLFSAALLFLALVFGGYAFFEYRKQWGDWTKEFGVAFSEAPATRTEQTKWLQERFAFQDKQSRLPVEPWLVRDGALLMKEQEWCWLENVRLRDDTKVFVELRFKGKPEAFQIALNSRRRLRQAENNPAGYSCRVGIWGGSMDLITRNEADRPNDFNGLVVSSLPDALGKEPGAGGVEASRTQKVSLTFQRQGERVALQMNGREVYHESYVMPLLVERNEQSTPGSQYDSIGVRTWGKEVELRSIYAYRFKLPEKASPIVAGDALAETGHLREAVAEYRTLATDYGRISPAIASLALFKGYLLATYRGDLPERRRLLTELREMRGASGRGLFRNDGHAQRLRKVLEAETLARWKDGDRAEALLAFEDIFKTNPETRIVLECLRMPHEALTPEESAELLRWAARTTRLAGLNLRSLGLSDLSALASLQTLRGFDFRNNQVSDLAPLRGMTNLRALYAAQNQVANLEPLRGLKLFELYLDGNRIESLAPLAGMPLETFYCSRNQISDLAPLKGQPLYVLGCAENRITSLDVAGDMPALSQLYCNHNQISDLAPLKGKALETLDCAENRITSLEAAAEMPSLNQLYCSQNQIASLEPLRRARQLQYLDCSSNQITSLAPLAGLDLKELNCSKNPLVSLEPFVSALDPPAAFAFDCDTVPDVEIQRAITAWSAKGLKYLVSSAQLLLAIRTGRFEEVKTLASEHNGHRYLYVQKLLRAEEAAAFCARSGGHLVTIANAEENNYLNQITPPGATCRIGLVVEAGKPRWVTSEPINFLPEQTEWRTQDKFTTWRGGSWDGSRRDKPMPFLVEWE